MIPVSVPATRATTQLRCLFAVFFVSYQASSISLWVSHRTPKLEYMLQLIKNDEKIITQWAFSSLHSRRLPALVTGGMFPNPVSERWGAPAHALFQRYGLSSTVIQTQSSPAASENVGHRSGVLMRHNMDTFFYNLARRPCDLCVMNVAETMVPAK